MNKSQFLLSADTFLHDLQGALTKIQTTLIVAKSGQMTVELDLIKIETAYRHLLSNSLRLSYLVHLFVQDTPYLLEFVPLLSVLTSVMKQMPPEGADQIRLQTDSDWPELISDKRYLQLLITCYLDDCLLLVKPGQMINLKVDKQGKWVYVQTRFPARSKPPAQTEALEILLHELLTLCQGKITLTWEDTTLIRGLQLPLKLNKNKL